MENDQFTALDIFLLSIFCLLVWALNVLVNSRNDREVKLKYHIEPTSGRRFYWKCVKIEKEKNESFSD